MKYRKKPIVIEAIKHTRNFDEIKEFLGDNLVDIRTERRMNGVCEVHIKTLDSIAIALEGDFICKGIQGEFYPCKADILEKTYDRVL